VASQFVDGLRASHLLAAGLGAAAGALGMTLWTQDSYPRETGELRLHHAHLQQSLISCDPPLFAGGLTPTSMLSKDPPATTNHARDAKTPGQDGPIRCLTVDSISDAAARAAPSVVNITVTYSGPAGAYLGRSSGSGVVISEQGDVVTNAHVVNSASNRLGGPQKIVVSMQDGRTFEGRVVSFDSVADLALIKVDSKDKLPAATLGSSSALRVGQWVVALGSPLHLQNSVTAGIISCVDRKGTDIGLRGGGQEYIQTDAAINQGNSGGPLVDLDGAVIGINNMKALAADGVSFAIPIDAVKAVVTQLQKHGKVVRPYIGIKMLELNPYNSKQIRDRDPTFPNVQAGVLIPQVHPGSPAERAGLQPGDVVVEFGGQQVKSVKDITDTIGYEAGKTWKMKVLRAGGHENVIYITSEATQGPL